MDKTILIVEDDVTFASILLDMAREAGLKGVISTAGAGTLNMARKLQPDAITLDLGLADINGFVLLDLLKHDPQTSGIPVHVISGYRSPKTNAMLARRSRKVAKNSYHMKGMAIDLRLPGCPLEEVRAAALSLGGGGVGFYPGPQFVHLDTGPVRAW